MMPGIIISLIFLEYGHLVFHAAPLQNQLSRTPQSLDDAANRSGVQISSSNLPRRTWCNLLALQ